MIKNIDLAVVPHYAMGPVRFNKKREENRKLLEAPRKTYAQTEGDLPNDTYETLGIMVIYDKYNVCGAVECRRPSKVIFQDLDLLSIPFAELKNWFGQLDADLRESQKDLISYRYGLAFFAPAKEHDPWLPCESITAFRKNFFNRKIGIPDPAIYSTFLLQPGFVEGVERDKEKFSKLPDAYRHIFRRTKEFAIILWNSFPVKLNYRDDLPIMIPDLVEMLNLVVNQPENGSFILKINTHNIRALLMINWKDWYLKIRAEWEMVPGRYEAALNEYPVVEILREEFLAEWKIVINQLIKGFSDSGVSLTGGGHKNWMEKLQRIGDKINNTGRLYGI